MTCGSSLDGGVESTEARLARAVAGIAHLLPAQGPITVFIHHNTLHAFEDSPFEEAVVDAGALFGCEPFLAEDRYRDELHAGRIVEDDVTDALRGDLGDAGEQSVAGVATRLELRQRLLSHGIPRARGKALHWLIQETDVLDRFRDDLIDTRDLDSGRGSAAAEKQVVRGLWEACLAAVRRASAARVLPRAEPVRHRDLLLQVTGVDSDEWVQALLIRFFAAFLDQGLAYWPMPEREAGLFSCFLRVVGQKPPPWADPRDRQLAEILATQRSREASPVSSLLRSLRTLGVDEGEWETFLTASALALRGFAGMFQQLQERPDRAQASAPKGSLVELLAVRLLVEEVALAYGAREALDYDGPLAELRAVLRPRATAVWWPSELDRAWGLFHLAQLLGLDRTRIEALAGARIDDLLAELDAFDEIARRRVFHVAYERRLRQRVYDALATAPLEPPEPPLLQAVFCLDEREESLRRHLEEVAPAAETHGVAGFFGVAMYYKGAEDAHRRPLCPATLVPEQEVGEVLDRAASREARLRARSRRLLGLLQRSLLVGSHTMVRGTLVTTLLGALAALPLVLRVLFPLLATRLARIGAQLVAPSSRRHLRLEGSSSAGRGYTPPEMAAIVRRLLEDTGIHGRLAPLVVLLGHGSTSLNNPHESAHDCGACGGGRGGPNARAFALMANDNRVRTILAEGGLEIDESTWFLGAEHNTCDDSITYFDLDALPAAHRADFEQGRRWLDEARKRNAHERCRRFTAVPSWYTPAMALAHVEARAADLAQPRPEYGHATNAFCVVGRRSRTRGLFLDRRAFLVSYDPTSDDAEGSIASRLLGAVVPVVAGISLEYYFSYVDPRGYGCGTKLPHNVTALLGVVDGVESDLRTGLPWQMVEIHEPVRLLLVVEAETSLLLALLERDAVLRRLVQNRWIYLASLDPCSATLHEYVNGRWVEAPTGPIAHGGSTSAECYRRRSEHLPFVALGERSRAPGDPR